MEDEKKKKSIVKSVKKEKTVRKKKDKKLKISDIKPGEGAYVGHLLHRIKAKEAQLTFFCVTVVLCIILVSLYFLFSSIQKPIRYNTLKVGNFEVTFNDRGNTLGNIVDLTPIRPMSLEEGQKIKSYKVKIVNTSSQRQSFQIKLAKDVAMIREDDCSDIQLPGQYIYYQVDTDFPQLLDGTKRSPIIYTNTLSGGGVQFIEIRVWVDDSVPERYQDYHFHGNLAVKTIETAG